MKRNILLFCLSLVLFNCTKSETISPISKAELLTKQVWKIKKYVMGTPSKQTVQLATDGTLYLQDISKISFTFKADGTFTDTDYLGTAYTNQTWKLLNNDTQIEFKNSTTGNTNTLTIDALDENNLTLTRVYHQNDTPADRWNALLVTLKTLGYGTNITECFITQTFTH